MASDPGACRTWLRAYNSRLDSLTNGLNDVSLMDSSVGVINLRGMRDFMAVNSNISLIEHLDWQGYSGAILNSKIREIMSFHSFDDLTISNVSIGRINEGGFKFSGNILLVNDTSFQRILTNGMHIITGNAILKNVKFNHLDKFGIHVKPSGTIELINVVIERCSQPCIVVPFENAARFVNVTINDEGLSARPGAVLYSEYDESTAVARDLSNYTQCDVQGTRIICDFEGYHEVCISLMRRYKVYMILCNTYEYMKLI